MNKIITLFMFIACLSGHAQMQTDTFGFSFEGKRYNGLLDFPGEKTPTALIVIIPGSGKTNMGSASGYYSSLRKLFIDNGFACCVWDKAGCGKSEGIYDGRQSVQNSAQEAMAAIEELKRRSIPGSDAIGLWGLSRGGWVCPLIITNCPSIKFWISVSGPDDKENTPYLLESNFRTEGRSEEQTQLLLSEWKNGNNIFRKGGTFEAYLKATHNLRKDSFWLAISGQQFTKEGFERIQKNILKENHPYDEKTSLRIYVPGFDTLLSKINCPVLAIFGEKDSQVDWKKTMALYKSTIGKKRGAGLTIKTFPNCNHNLFKCKTGAMMEDLGDVEFCDNYFEMTIRWLKEWGFCD